jgi:hypothetical protein
MKTNQLLLTALLTCFLAPALAEETVAARQGWRPTHPTQGKDCASSAAATASW